MIKDINNIKIPYWISRYILLDLYWRLVGDKKELKLTIWFCREYYKGEVASWWKHILLYRGKIK